jgi:hypothetical protein
MEAKRVYCCASCSANRIERRAVKRRWKIRFLTQLFIVDQKSLRCLFSLKRFAILALAERPR